MAKTHDFDEKNEDFPAELAQHLLKLDESLTDVESNLINLQKVPFNELQEKLTPLEKAKIDLVGAYTINSLFWVYLNTQGLNPKEHAVKHELDRIRSYLTRVKEIQDAESAPKLNVEATKRFVRNALWDAAHKSAGGMESATKRKSDQAVTESSTTGNKPEVEHQHSKKKKHK